MARMAVLGTLSRSLRSCSGQGAHPPPAVSFSWSSRSVIRTGKQTSKMAKYQIVMVRHGESEWNKLNKFCGWHDAELSEQGELQQSRMLLPLAVCYHAGTLSNTPR